MPAETKRDVNRHLWHQHNTRRGGTLRERLIFHEELHLDTECDHEHEDYEQPARWERKPL